MHPPRYLLVALLVLAVPTLSCAGAVVVKQTLDQATAGKQVLENGDLERTENDQIVGLTPWQKGYVIDTAARSGKVAARCELKDLQEGQRGLTYVVTLNQTHPLPFTAELWSKCQAVSGAADGNYSLYIDLTYMDGTPLWGQIAPFSAGTHDWQRRTVTLVPEKPVKEVQFHGIFRNHTGTAWFDDFSLTLLELPAGCTTFDGIPVVRPGEVTTPALPGPENLILLGLRPLALGGGGPVYDVTSRTLALDRRSGVWPTASGRKGGLFVRDARRRSAFRQPLGPVTATGDGLHWEATDEELGLKLRADYRVDMASGAVRIDGVVEDLTGEDRGVSVYCALPVPRATTWYDDMRSSRSIEPGVSYSNCTTVGCGANGKMSLYPFGCVATATQATCIGAPLDPPHLFRFAYDATSYELYGVQDVGLSKDCLKSPSRAPFAFVLYRVDPPTFRAGLDRYYRLFPEHFAKRTTVEGNWVAFDDIAPVQGFEDFGIAFKEGTNNPAFDEAHGILTYTYVEPMSHWLAMGDLPRTPEAALALLDKQAHAKPPVPHATATMASAIRSAEGNRQLSIEDTPWCNGALFINNPDPDLPTTAEYPLNQGQLLWKSINSALGERQDTIAGWRPFGIDYEIAPGAGRGGSQAALCRRPEIGQEMGLAQSISLQQKAPARIVIRAWSKAEAVSGAADRDYSVYADLTLANGKPSWGHSTPFHPGTHDWEPAEVVIDLDQPVSSVSLHLLFRGSHTGTVWFDDVSVTVDGADKNLVTNPGLEPQQATQARVDGTYIDSLEMAATSLDFDRRHWAAADAPLVFTTAEGLPAELVMFASYDFIKDVSEQMHAQGRTIFANAVLHRFAQPAAVLDVMGTETNWRWGGKWSPMTDRDCNFKRALCYQRPYLLLQNTVFEDFGVELVERYMKRAVFYGLFPSFFSHNAAERTYWTRPDTYNRDRHLFKRYLPVCQAISAAGWEPLTWATTANDKVYVERYGKGPELYFALFNDSAEERDYSLSIDLKSLGVQGTGLQDVLEGKAAPATLQGDQMRLNGKLGSEDLKVLKVVGP